MGAPPFPPPPLLFNCYFQVAFQIQLPKLFDLSLCLLTRKRTFACSAGRSEHTWKNLARLPALAKFSHTKRPARGSEGEDERDSRRDFKGSPCPAPARPITPPPAYIRRGCRGGLSHANCSVASSPFFLPSPLSLFAEGSFGCPLK